VSVEQTVLRISVLCIRPENAFKVQSLFSERSVFDAVPG
jgi:hypothetical protein